jgi:hypothetical protein
VCAARAPSLTEPPVLSGVFAALRSARWPYQMEMAALKAAKEARERWTVPPGDMTLRQVKITRCWAGGTSEGGMHLGHAWGVLLCDPMQIRAYDGSDPNKTIIVAVNGRIYNVWRVCNDGP